MFIKLTNPNGNRVLFNLQYVEQISAVSLHDRLSNYYDSDVAELLKSRVRVRVLDTDDRSDRFHYFRETLEQIELLISIANKA